MSTPSQSIHPLADLPVLPEGADPKRIPSQRWQDGMLIAFDKPSGWSSFDVIRAVRRVIPVKKIGHAGTLDPLATGLLLCCTGRATKRISELQDLPKTYRARIRLGATSPSLDRGTQVSETAPWEPVELSRIQAILDSRFTGVIQQLPPDYSALKVGGRRAYDLARKGEATGLEPRPVTVHRITAISQEYGCLDIEVECGKGTYIRSLARDVACALGTVGMLESLRRTQSGGLNADHAWDPTRFRELFT